jgi:presenilin-like A22 family membrane protease
MKSLFKIILSIGLISGVFYNFLILIAINSSSHKVAVNNSVSAEEMSIFGFLALLVVIWIPWKKAKR